METSTPLGTSNVGFEDDYALIEEKLDYAAEDLGLSTVRANAGKPAMLGAQVERDKGAFVMEQCADRDLRVLFNFVIPRGQLSDSDVTIANLQLGGRRWGDLVAGSAYSAAVIGFAPQNEFDLDVLEVLNTQGRTAAEAMAATHAQVVREFCRGVRSAPGAWPAAATLLPGGMANPETAAAVIALTPLVPDLLPGLGGAPPLLNGIALHWYKEERHFTFAPINYEIVPPPPGSPLIGATLKGPSLAARTSGLFAALRAATETTSPRSEPRPRPPSPTTRRPSCWSSTSAGRRSVSHSRIRTGSRRRRQRCGR